MIAVGFVLTCLGVVLITTGVRFPLDRQFASPVAIQPGAWWAVTLAVVVGAVLTTWRGTRRLPPGRRGAAARIWGFFPLLFGAGWLALSPSQYGPRDFLILGGLLVLLAAFFARDLLAHRDLGLGRAHFWAALRWLAPPTLAMAAFLFFNRTPSDDDVSTPIAVALLTYPLYALVQILVFQSLLVRSLQTLGVAPAGIAAVTSIVFAIVHWPNPAVMAACLAGMLLWTVVYLRHRNALAVALSMGVTAAALTQWGPSEWTHHMRVGPNYVLTRQRHRDEAAWSRRVDAHAADPYYRSAGNSLAGYVEALYRDLLGRAPSYHEARTWHRTILREYRAYVVRQFHNSPEYLGKNPHLPLQELPDIDFLRRDFTPPHVGFEKMDRLLAPSFYRAQGGEFYGWLRQVYHEVLDRTPPEDNLRGWAATPPFEQRRRLAAEFLRLGDYFARTVDE